MTLISKQKLHHFFREKNPSNLFRNVKLPLSPPKFNNKYNAKFHGKLNQRKVKITKIKC